MYLLPTPKWDNAMKSLWNFFRRQKAITEAEVVELGKEPSEQPKVYTATMAFEDDDFDDEDDEDLIDDNDDDDWDDDYWDDADDDDDDDECWGDDEDEDEWDDED
jgi:hypothetical protein